MRNTNYSLVLFAVSTFLMSAMGPGPETDLSDRTWVSSLSEDTWLVRTISEFSGFGPVESNALLITGLRESVLIDTPVTPAQTGHVLDWAEKGLHRPVRHLVVTHWHDDRMGGIAAAVARGIRTYALARTIELARQHKLTLPQQVLQENDTRRLAGVPLEFFYPGHGHTSDNLLVWYAPQAILHAGCFAKSADARTLGNLKEISVPEWRSGTTRVQQRYPKAVIVIPGHGRAGGMELLDHTARLLDAAPATPPLSARP